MQRSAQVWSKISLFFLSIRMCRYMDLVFQRLQLEHNQILMLWWYKYNLRTLPLDPPRVITHDCKSLNKHGILIPYLGAVVTEASSTFHLCLI
ncbi:hypothetical protein CARUB_v10006281mg [Capsella rubella]|uniref:Uncharacterized protein n=1 Tax=Capsella rubella TaxID=81985 RepID=R0F7K1_9BRAS|nr:hypothetical protein CARUB_v10006281mg [Capsella rubella]